MAAALGFAPAVLADPTADKLEAPTPAPPPRVTVTAGAMGTFTPEGGKPVQLVHAASFVDAEDARKPRVIVLSDVKLPAETWKSEADLAAAVRGKHRFTGVVLFLDAEGDIYRTDTYENGRQASASGHFEVTVQDPKSPTLTGQARTKEGVTGLTLDVVFRVPK